ncbi:Transcriptional regulatory protein GlrR [Fundidesulfovibrio magnetotacticus]|uniref:Transcriptional regulatory protein GlrR n=1 Tax=Fundidesulfovibrio magnetotacticus TaxID=2730080 RepID=A0A6V8LLH8_9BACT|nr:sigma 54-interacting transcriptional regulator [Fundidesulfovibrio magnetotacticus]GFK93512.1 Transcriptional regulatory protein GlrR [Fundidesulfovibrio magnetotacticus]
MARILIVDDDEITRMVLSDIIGAEGHTVYAEPSLARGVKIAESIPIDLVFLDVFLPDGNGLEYLVRFTQLPSNPLVIIITNAGNPNGAELAIRNGAWDYVEKPFSPKDLQLSIRQAVAFREKKGDTLPVKRSRIVGSSPQLLQCIQEMSRAARSNVRVLFYGETGVGKDLFVRALHENCSVSNGPFVIVDCASLQPTIAGSELFGHKKGSFTSAVSANQGLIQQAHGGTLFLDEISELDLETQKLLLRVLETHRYRPLGEHHEVHSDFRFVCASNRDLEAMVGPVLRSGDGAVQLQHGNRRIYRPPPAQLPGHILCRTEEARIGPGIEGPVQRHRRWLVLCRGRADRREGMGVQRQRVLTV